VRAAMCDATVQLGGDGIAHMMRVDAFRRELDRGGAFQTAVRQYVQALLGFVTQSVACNTLHSVESRCCRWLLHAQDRVRSHDLPLTHDLLATMLGVRRPTITLVLAKLVRHGIVSTARGTLRITDTNLLKAQACECYEVVQQNFAVLHPVEVSPRTTRVEGASLPQPAYSLNAITSGRASGHA
jgi:hypothetical protein